MPKHLATATFRNAGSNPTTNLVVARVAALDGGGGQNQPRAADIHCTATTKSAQNAGPLQLSARPRSNNVEAKERMRGPSQRWAHGSEANPRNRKLHAENTVAVMLR
jgi:hypothetical protein